MGNILAARVVKGTDLFSQNRYILFRPKNGREKQAWRDKADLSFKEHIPSFLHPERAEVRAFRSFDTTCRKIETSWGRPYAVNFAMEVSAFGEIIGQLASARGFGFFGLCTFPEKSRPQLQSVHLLLPAEPEHKTYGAPDIPLIAALVKAPDSSLKRNREGWEKNYWGIEVAVMIHAINTYCERCAAALGRESVAMNSMKVETFDGHLLDNGLTEAKALDIIYDFGIFQVQAKRVPHKQLVKVNERSTIWGFELSAENARGLVAQYHQTIEAIFGPAPRPEKLV